MTVTNVRKDPDALTMDITVELDATDLGDLALAEIPERGRARTIDLDAPSDADGSSTSKRGLTPMRAAASCRPAVRPRERTSTRGVVQPSSPSAASVDAAVAPPPRTTALCVPSPERP